MKQIVKIALALVVLQVVLTKATPTSPRVVPTDKDTLIDMLAESYRNFLIEQQLQSGLNQIPLLKESIAAIESKKNDKITAATIQDLKKEVDGFIETFEQWNADKTNCALQQDVKTKIWNLQLTIDDILGYEKYNKFLAVNKEKYDTEFTSLRTQFLWVLAEYVKAMPENLPEKQTLKVALEKSDHEFCSAFDDYLDNENDTEAPGIYTTACNNKVTAAGEFLIKMMIWML